MYFNYIVNKMNFYVVYVFSIYGCNESVFVYYNLKQFSFLIFYQKGWYEMRFICYKMKYKILFE